MLQFRDNIINALQCSTQVITEIIKEVDAISDIRKGGCRLSQLY